ELRVEGAYDYTKRNNPQVNLFDNVSGWDGQTVFRGPITNAIWGTPEKNMLRRARLDAARVEPGYKGNQLGLPTFLLGGAIISTLFSGIHAFIRWAFSGMAGIIILAAVLAVVFGGLAWAALYAAGVARRRIRLSTDQPMHALWETIGACGNPPKDSSYDFAAYAIVLLTLTWVLVPTAVWLIVTRGFQ
ncbi:MAG: hypothetical protein HY826_13655, partial [Actinobacteria bacterium]|nr:hypothetical protein [Actinomycetota bacterium]